jgi:hypothetical protein
VLFGASLHCADAKYNATGRGKKLRRTPRGAARSVNKASLLIIIAVFDFAALQKLLTASL